MENKTLGLDNRAYVGQLFKAAFGRVPVYLTFPLGKSPTPELLGYEPQIRETVLPEEAERKSIYGTPIVFPMKFLGGQFKKYDDKGRLVDTSLHDFWLPDATMADFSRSKNIIKTATLGANGTVKEVYGFDDWNISIDIKSISGSPGVIPIEITAVSDEAVELAITLND